VLFTSTVPTSPVMLSVALARKSRVLPIPKEWMDARLESGDVGRIGTSASLGPSGPLPLAERGRSPPRGTGWR
jgi:hypothetical protein